MTINKRIILYILFEFLVGLLPLSAQNLIDGTVVTAEVQASVADGTTPLWLNANHYGLSSLDSKNGYVRASAIRSVSTDSLKEWRFGYGVDLALAKGFTNTLIAQQIYAEVQWKKLRLTVGSKEQPMEFTAPELTSGALAFGANARPIPQVRLEVDWFPFPGTKGLWQWKAIGSYGMMTDGRWLRNNHNEHEHYTGNVLYHEKAIAWKFGNEKSNTFPLTYELSLRMAAQFGGTTYNATGRGLDGPTNLKHSVNLGTFFTVLVAGGADETDGTSLNTRGNHMGEWAMRLKWTGKDWSAAARFERYFEDQSMMFIQYGIYDHLLGFDAELPSNPFLSAFTVEHISTYDQSGAVLHDQATVIPDKMNGRDNYYNHNLYSGYQHWGQTMGNPLITSPVYNHGAMSFLNNRIKAWHLGLMGDPTSWLHWRMLLSFTKNYGTYDYPLIDMEKQNYYLLETTVHPSSWKGLKVCAGLGLDRGEFLGNSLGGQLTISHTLFQ